MTVILSNYCKSSPALLELNVEVNKVIYIYFFHICWTLLFSFPCPKHLLRRDEASSTLFNFISAFHHPSPSRSRTTELAAIRETMTNSLEIRRRNIYLLAHTIFFSIIRTFHASPCLLINAKLSRVKMIDSLETR